MYSVTTVSSLTDPSVVSESVPVCKCSLSRQQSLLHNTWPLVTQWAELCWISGRKMLLLLLWADDGPKWPLKTGRLNCPHPWEEHLITQVTFCMSALNLPLTREPLQTWDRQGALGGIIAPAALCCFDVRLSPTHPSPPFLSQLLIRLFSSGTITERPSTGKLNPENLPSVAHFHSHMQTHSHTN